MTTLMPPHNNNADTTVTALPIPSCSSGGGGGQPPLLPLMPSILTASDDKDTCTLAVHFTCSEAHRLALASLFTMDNQALEVSCSYVRCCQKHSTTSIPHCYTNDSDEPPTCNLCRLQMTIAVPPSRRLSSQPRMAIECHTLRAAERTITVLVNVRVVGGSNGELHLPSSSSSSSENRGVCNMDADDADVDQQHNIILSDLLGHTSVANAPSMPLLNLFVVSNGCPLRFSDMGAALHDVYISTQHASTIQWVSNKGYTRCRTLTVNAADTSNVFFESHESGSMLVCERFQRHIDRYAFVGGHGLFACDMHEEEEQQQQADVADDDDCLMRTTTPPPPPFVPSLFHKKKQQRRTATAAAAAAAVDNTGLCVLLCPTQKRVPNDFSVAVIDAPVPLFQSTSVPTMCHLCGTQPATFQLLPCQHPWACDDCVHDCGGAAQMLIKLHATCPLCRSVTALLARCVPAVLSLVDSSRSSGVGIRVHDVFTVPIT